MGGRRVDCKRIVSSFSERGFELHLPRRALQRQRTVETQLKIDPGFVQAAGGLQQDFHAFEARELAEEAETMMALRAWQRMRGSLFDA